MCAGRGGVRMLTVNVEEQATVVNSVTVGRTASSATATDTTRGNNNYLQL